jgi:hypothetical protein
MKKYKKRSLKRHSKRSLKRRLKRSSKRSSKRSLKKYSKRSSKRSLKKYSRKRSKSSFKRRDGGLGPSKFDLYVKEREEIKNILKGKVVNFLEELQNDDDITEYYKNIKDIEKEFFNYITEYIRKPIKIRIYSLSSPERKTKTYNELKNYLIDKKKY